MITEFLLRLDVWLDRVRIRRHFKRVEQKLRRADNPDLSADQRLRRLSLLDHLRGYGQRGMFPHNPGYPERTPIFVDDEGRMCAVASLLAASGQMALVDTVRQRANLARVRQMNFPELDRWAVQSGFTKEELVLIQPAYGSLEYSATIHTPILWLTLAGIVAIVASLVRPLRKNPKGTWALAASFFVIGALLAYVIMGWGLTTISDAEFSCSRAGCPEANCTGPMCGIMSDLEVRYYLLDPIFSGAPTVISKSEGMFEFDLRVEIFRLGSTLLAEVLLAVGMARLAMLTIDHRYGPELLKAHRAYRAATVFISAMLVITPVFFVNWPSLPAMIEKAAPNPHRTTWPPP